jgi:predicted transcriptional regulator/transcriptional regulator with XRE-family HTH domain
MGRAPIGQRIRKRRQELARSQKALAAEIGISSSYLNLIEHNKRSIGGALAHRIAEALAIDSRALSGTEEARLIAEIDEIAEEPALAGLGLEPGDAARIVAASDKAARAILALYRVYRETKIRSELIGERLGEPTFLTEASHQILSLMTTVRSYAAILKDYGDLSESERTGFMATLSAESERLAERGVDLFDFIGGRGARRPLPSPREEVEDFVSDRANYFPRVESAADATRSALASDPSPGLEAMLRYLQRRHHVMLRRVTAGDTGVGRERLSDDGRELLLPDDMDRSSVRFRVARLIAALEHGELLARITDEGNLNSRETEVRVQKVLASYFAGALMMPYAPFHAAATRTRMDVMALARAFDASFEQTCHRLATLRRPGAEGIPLHFLRVDIAGNISKRFSASGLSLPRYGGACPRWIVHHAFAQPGRVLTQVGRLPDGQTYLFVARAEAPQHPLHTTYAVMIGAAMVHAERFAYADSLPASAVMPVGVSCRLCPREDCGQRAYDRLPGIAGNLAARP